jgi:hypothetical protein
MKTAGFSLTLTLSRWEREQPLADFVKLAGRGAEAAFYFAMKAQRDFVKKLGAFLPLPAGEGRGESARDKQTASSENWN